MTITISRAALTGSDNPAYQVSRTVWGTPLSTSMATGSLVGRTTASAGAFEEISVGTGLLFGSLSLSFDTTFGDGRYSQINILGTPKQPLFSCTVPDNYFLLSFNTLILSGAITCALQGDANLLVTDLFQTRSRVILAGRGF